MTAEEQYRQGVDRRVLALELKVELLERALQNMMDAISPPNPPPVCPTCGDTGRIEGSPNSTPPSVECPRCHGTDKTDPPTKESVT